MIRQPRIPVNGCEDIDAALSWRRHFATSSGNTSFKEPKLISLQNVLYYGLAAAGKNITETLNETLNYKK